MPADAPHPLGDRLRRTLNEVAATQDPAGDWDALVAHHRAGPRTITLDRPRPARGRRLLVAAVALVALVSAAVGLRALRSDEPHGVTTTPPSTTAPSPSTSPPSTTVPSQTTPFGETNPMPPLPIDLAYEELPDQGFLTRSTDGTVRLLDLGGELLATTTSPAFASPGSVLLVRGTGDDEAPTVAVAHRPVPLPAPEGCEQPRGYRLEPSATAGDISVSVCGPPNDPEGPPRSIEDPAATPREIWITEGGETTVLTGAPPDPSFGDDEVAGHWVEAEPSPDGRWVLAQWSGECESPSSWLVPTDGRAPVPAGSFSLSGDGTTVLEAGGLGWAADGRAIVRFTGGICGAGITGPGIYAVDPDTGEATVLVPDGDEQPSVWLWSKGARTPPELAPEDRDAAAYSVDRLLAGLRSGSAAAAARYWGGWSDLVDDPAPGSIEALEAFADAAPWLLTDPDPELTAVASFGWTAASPVVVVTVDLPDGGRRSAAFVVGGEVPGAPRQVLALPGEQASTPAAGRPIEPGATIVVDGLPVEGGARAYVDGAEVTVEVDHERQTTTITVPDDLDADGVVVVLTRASPELPEAMAWWFPVAD